jgi:hypothetical protein
MTGEIRAKISSAVSADRNPNWLTGSWSDSDGRVYVRVPDAERGAHPTMRRDGYIRRYHRVWNLAYPENKVMAGDVIHHKNEIKNDDRIENLQKTVQADHARGHGLGRVHTPEARARMRAAQRARRARERDS